MGFNMGSIGKIAGGFDVNSVMSKMSSVSEQALNLANSKSNGVISEYKGMAESAISTYKDSMNIDAMSAAGIDISGIESEINSQISAATQGVTDIDTGSFSFSNITTTYM